MHLPPVSWGCEWLLAGWGCPNKVRQTNWLKQQKFIFLQFWRLAAQGATGWSVLGSLSLLCSRLPSHCALTQPFSGGALLVSLLIRILGPLDEDPTSWPHLNLIISLKALNANTVTLGVCDTAYEFGGDIIQYITEVEAVMTAFEPPWSTPTLSHRPSWMSPSPGAFTNEASLSLYHSGRPLPTPSYSFMAFSIIKIVYLCMRVLIYGLLLELDNKHQGPCVFGSLLFLACGQVFST